VSEAPEERPDELDLDMPTVEKILVSFLREECATAEFSRGVLGLSGGLDSAVVCVLAARALGPENVTAVIMPAATSSPDSVEDAMLVARECRVPVRTVSIVAMSEAYLTAVPDADRVRRGNVYARCRMIVLYDLSAEVHGLVLGTSNKTELLLGYGTLFGDMASAINPIGDLYKTQVKAMGRHLGLPERVLEKPPSADLWVGQTDEEELGAPYSMIDRLLYRVVDQRTPLARVVESGFDPEFVRSITNRIRLNQYKRRPPVIAKLLNRTIGPDFRLPRDSGLALDRAAESIVHDKTTHHRPQSSPAKRR
jgi:NAD+ synthase